jgi:cold shock protein
VLRRTTGVVRCYDGSKGYGYINAEDGTDVFVHYSAVTDKNKPLLPEGEQVNFFLENSVHGPQAADVLRLN